jgi:two-component system cell cycle sensor histidine kinase/response regulator CckA
MFQLSGAPTLHSDGDLSDLVSTLLVEIADPFFLFDFESEQVLQWNPQAQQLTGSLFPALARVPIMDLFDAQSPDEMQRWRAVFRRTGFFHSANGYRVRHADDDRRIPVDLTISRVQAGSRTLGLLMARDLRAQREVELELRRRKAELHRLLGSLSDCVWSMEGDAQGRWSMNYCSPVIEKITGRPSIYFDADPQRWRSVVHPEDRDRVMENFARLGDRVSSELEYRIILPEGEIRWVRDRFQITHVDGGGVRLDGVIADITERRRAEEASQLVATKYRDLVETSNDLIWSVDGMGCWTFVNRKAAMAIYGYEPEEMLGRPFVEFLAPGQIERDAATFERLLRGESVFHYKTTHRRKDGALIRMLFNAIPACDADGRVVGTTGTAADITQKQRVEDALAESRQRFEAFMNSVPLVCYIKDAEGKHLYHNREFVAKFPDARQRMLGRRDDEFWPPEIAGPLRANDLAVLTSDSTIELREQVPTPDGLMREWYAIKFPFRDAHGQVYLGGIAVDLTERQQVEEELKVSEERYRLLFERNLAGVFRSATDGRLLDCNESFARILGFASRDQAMMHRTPSFFYDPADRIVLLERLAESTHLTNYEIRMRRQDGEPVWVIENLSLRTDSDGEAVLEGTMIDITPRKRVEEELRASEARYRTLIDNLDECVFLKNPDSTYLAGNPVFCAQLGLSEEELRGKSDDDLFPADLADQFRVADRAVLSEGRSVQSSLAMVVAGKTRTFRFNRTPVKNDAGAIVGVLGIGWDITEQLAMESQLRHVQKMDAVGQLAGGIAHDFNNLLTIILGNLSVALLQPISDKATHEALRNAESASLRAAELTRSLLGFARQTPMQAVPISLRNSIGDLVRLVRSTIGPRVDLEIQSIPDLWEVKGDPGQLNQVLMNLTLNARDAMPHGGFIRFHLGHFVPDEDYLRLHVEASPGEYVCLRVEDTGHGIAESIRQRVFEPFFTTKEKGKGTGLGLAIVFGIVKNHGGWITCESEPLRGTIFRVYLPRHHEKAVAETSAPAAEAPTGTDATILVVDDEGMIRNMARAILARAGFDVMLADNGAMALEIYRSSPRRIDLVVLDSIMPHLGGRETLVELAKLDPEARVLFSSGFSSDSFRPDEFPQVRGFIPKPYRSDELVQKVRAILEEARQRRGVSR